MNMQIQYGLPGVSSISEDRIASSRYLGCTCGLNHWVPCWRRSVCLGLKQEGVKVERNEDKRRLASSKGQEKAVSASWDLIRGIFPDASIINESVIPFQARRRPRMRQAAGRLGI